MKQAFSTKLVLLLLLSGLSVHLVMSNGSTKSSAAASAMTEEKDEAKRKVLIERGRTLFNGRCTSCHGIDGQHPKSEEADLRLKKGLTYDAIFKTAKGRFKGNEEDGRAVAHFIMQIIEKPAEKRGASAQ